MRVLIGRSSKVIVPAAAAARSSKPRPAGFATAGQDNQRQFDQVGCSLRTWKRSGSCGDSNASSVSSERA